MKRRNVSINTHNNPTPTQLRLSEVPRKVRLVWGVDDRVCAEPPPLFVVYISVFVSLVQLFVV